MHLSTFISNVKIVKESRYRHVRRSVNKKQLKTPHSRNAAAGENINHLTAKFGEDFDRCLAIMSQIAGKSRTSVGPITAVSSKVQPSRIH